ncbi:cell division protein FtsK [uncultured Streptococcus sp.]|uniref:cell division protein FtsK n=1 Tax=uncultured Streptococcus sp. TaxID=83427 RepID=UPI0027DAE5D9|nr:cell division protein FtsK [uncultured Streptococcus sp.]
MVETRQLGGEELEKFLTTNLNNTLSINGETSYTNSFSIRLVEGDKGFLFIPNLPVSYALDSQLYFQIADICSGILYPYKTLLLQNNTVFVPYATSDPSLARALFFPWVDGIPTRLEIEDIDSFIAREVSETCIPLMANHVSLDLTSMVHLAVSGVSGSGKSYFVEYLIRCLRHITDDITLVDPKMADIYVLGQDLNLPVLAPKHGSNLNSFITQVNEVLGQVIDKIYQRQQVLLKKPKAELKRSYLVIDELLALVQGSSKQARDTFAQLLGTVALLGRATNVSLVLLSQRFDASAFGGNLAVREQVNCAIILGEINANTTQFLLPNAHIDNLVVPSGLGTGIIKFTDGKHDSHIMPLLTPHYHKREKSHD